MKKVKSNQFPRSNPYDPAGIFTNPDGTFVCDSCNEKGYCTRKEKIYFEEISKSKVVYTISDKEISNMVLLNIPKDNRFYSAYIRKYLQIAIDAFHQDDYETAIINSNVVLAQKNNCNEALFCLAVSYYFLADYEQAIDYAHRISSSEYRLNEDKICAFIDKCKNTLYKNKMAEKKEAKTLPNQFVNKLNMCENHIKV